MNQVVKTWITRQESRLLRSYRKKIFRNKIEKSEMYVIMLSFFLDKVK